MSKDLSEHKPAKDLPSGKIGGLYMGKVEHKWEDNTPTAIDKKIVDHAVDITFIGFNEDQQADLTVHGGPEKAIHHYPSDHMAFWRELFPDHASKFVAGCFGENISTTGLDETNLCLGDILKLGTATVEICQGRQPCWKLSEHLDLIPLAMQFQKSGRTGWYYRVLEEGKVQAGDVITVIKRPLPNWTLKRLIKARFNPKIDIQTAEELCDLPALSESWKAAFLKKCSVGYVEDTKRRLRGLS